MRVGQIVLYKNAEKNYLAKITRIQNNYAWIQTHLGETASRCDMKLLQEIENDYAFLVYKRSVECENDIKSIARNIANVVGDSYIDDVYNIINNETSANNIPNINKCLASVNELNNSIIGKNISLALLQSYGYKVITSQGIFVENTLNNINVIVSDVIGNEAYLDEKSSNAILLLLTE